MTDADRVERSPSPLATALSFIWAVLPLLSLGFLSPLVFGYAAGRRRSWPLWTSTGAYSALVLTMFATASSATGTAADVVFKSALVGSWLVGTAHALAIRRTVFAPQGRDRNQEAIAAAQRRADLRREARELAARDPDLARELGVGRPDAPREYDDGGLVDVNHATAATLAGLPGMNRHLADKVVRAREEVGAFVSVEEMSVLADLPPHLTPRLDEFTVFL
ncbi:helix-hairpin-helix domain-containing protein [Thermopolyspora sp. NPDC052614]|uniref:ComEA family DNA-binding protein n=1 Tax=Thermopolyspora sp. NPDC052614 TaxID=3155682 RepID=UPI0034486301